MLHILDYREFLNVLENQSDIKILEEPLIKDLIQCRDGHDSGCCKTAAKFSKTCNVKLYSLIDEYKTNSPDMTARLKTAFGHQDVKFELSDQQINL